MAQPSPVPVRYPSGVSTDFPWGPLANFGRPNPFGYHVWSDDFDGLNALYTVTASGAGTVAATPVDGGALLFTTDAGASDLASIQLPIASFSYTAGKKMFFLCRIQVSSASLVAFRAGLIQTTTTPFTAVNGVFFSKVTGSAANLLLNVTASSANVATTIPTAAYTFADATNIDLGWYIDRQGNVFGFVGAPLVGYLPAQFATNPGPVVMVATGTTIPTAVMNPTLVVQAGTATVKTMTANFMMAAVER